MTLRSIRQLRDDGGWEFVAPLLLPTENQIDHYRGRCITLGNSPVLVSVERHLIEPNVIRLLFVISIQLEGNVDFFLVPVWLRRVIGIDVVGLVVYVQRDVVNLIADAL